MEKISVKLAKNISQIMAEFDFETTVKILKLMDIKWTRDDEERYPTLDDVREMANQLIWDAIEYADEKVTDVSYSETGCFRAEYHKENKDEYVELIFEPCVWRKEC